MNGYWHAKQKLSKPQLYKDHRSYLSPFSARQSVLSTQYLYRTLIADKMGFSFGRSSSSKRSSKGTGSSSQSSSSMSSMSSRSSRSSSRTGWEYLSDRSSQSSQASRDSQSSYYSGASSSTIRPPRSSHTVRPRDLTTGNMMAYNRASGSRMDDLESVGAGSSVSQDRYGNPRRSKGSSRYRSKQPASDVSSRSSTSTVTPNIVTIRPKGVHANSHLGSVTSNGSSRVHSRSSSRVRNRSRAPSRHRASPREPDWRSPGVQYAAPRGLGMSPARAPTSYPSSDLQSVGSSQTYSDDYSDNYSDTPMGMAMVPQQPSSYAASDLNSLGSSGYGPPGGGAAGDLCRQCGSSSAQGRPTPGHGSFPGGDGANITVVVNSTPGPCTAPCPTPCPPPCCGSSFSASCCSYGPCC